MLTWGFCHRVYTNGTQAHTILLTKSTVPCLSFEFSTFCEVTDDVAWVLFDIPSTFSSITHEQMIENGELRKSPWWSPWTRESNAMQFDLPNLIRDLTGFDLTMTSGPTFSLSFTNERYLHNSISLFIINAKVLWFCIFCSRSYWRITETRYSGHWRCLWMTRQLNDPRL